MSDQPDNEAKFLKSVKQQLFRAEQSLTDDELRALRLARGRAVAAVEKPKHVWLAAGAVAVTISVVAIVIGLYGLQIGTVEQAYEISAHPIEDMQLLSTKDELEFYEELEFYQWLEFEDRTG